MNRLSQLRERKGAIEQEMAESDRPNGQFDHEAWLVCEHESLKLEIRRFRQMETVEGGVDYEQD